MTKITTKARRLTVRAKTPQGNVTCKMIKMHTVDSIRYLSFFNEKKKELTAVFGHFPGDLKQYPGVTGDHDEEWEEEEEGEGKHVVKCLVPA